MGNPRSGTSFLRIILNQNDYIIAPPESGFAHWWRSKYFDWNLNDLITQRLDIFIDDILSSKKMETWQLDRSTLKAKIYELQPENYSDLINSIYLSYDLRKKNVKCILDKNNYYINHLNDIIQIWRDAIFIHIIRDGRDVACSYKELTRLSDTYKYKPTLPISISEIAFEWMNNVRNIQSFLSNQPDAKSLTIKYEDLVIDTERTIKRLCEFLEVPYQSNMKTYYLEKDVKKIEPIELMPWKRKINETPDESRIGRFKIELNEREISEFNNIAGRLLNEYAYIL